MNRPVASAAFALACELSLAPHSRALTYCYGESKSYLHKRCVAADVELADEAPLAAAITLPATPPAQRPPTGAPKISAVAQKPDTADAPAAPNPVRTRELNRSHCLAMESTASDFFGFVNKCAERANYANYTLSASTANVGLTRCAIVLSTDR